ncbi:MAG: biotin/lipoyl-binding protein [Dehalococcoidia bacterium]|nr:biotin/lipoyl-binding protein [Dehalococcoidia bacterium]
MDYRLKLDENVISFHAEKKGDHGIALSRDGRIVDIEYTAISEYHQYLVVDGCPLNVFIARDGNTKMVVIRGISYYIGDADAPDSRSRGKKRDQVMPQEVTPPMPAVVVRILVSPGDSVKQGDSVIVVSSMKMETTLSAPTDGKVRAVNVTEGEKVMPGQILIDIDRDTEPQNQ